MNKIRKIMGRIYSAPQRFARRYREYHRVLDGNALSLTLRDIWGSNAIVTVRIRELSFPIRMRLNSSDLPVLTHIFATLEYDLPMQSTPRLIIDAGANIGMASIYFARRFPEAKIIAIEPEQQNFQLLEFNVKPYGNIVPVNAALWHEEKKLSLASRGTGSWGFTVSAGGDSTGLEQVRTVTIPGLMKQYNFDTVDLFKIDIEGAEREIFEHCQLWIEHVGVIAAELHDRIKQGCERAYYRATRDFDVEFSKGETRFVLRNAYVPHPRPEVFREIEKP